MPACDRSTGACACTYSSCSRRGNCCQCVAFHRGRGEAPACFFTPSGEKTYDRSLAHLMRDRRVTA